MVTFNVNIWGIKKSYFCLPRLSSVTMATSLSGGTRDFLKLSFHMFPYNEILIVFQISAKSVRGFGSYEHLKFRPMRQLKYRL